jgi:thiamine biosynthesis lipoprotein
VSGTAVSTWRALGTSANVVVTKPAALAPARESVEAVLAAVDAACSRFRDDSELVRLCSAGGGTAMRVGSLLFEAIEVALDAARVTGGAVDPTVGVALESIGYDRDVAEIAGDGPPVRAEPAPGWRTIRLERATKSVRLPPGVLLDLGATAKALAADRAAVIAASVAGCGVLVSLGGDIAVAGAAPGDGWPIALGDDHASPTGGPVVTIESGGLATSSTTVRRWRRGGATVHHIVDPATGAPCEVTWRTVTVAARTCVEANVASTAAIVLGQRAPEWLEGRDLAARLVDANGCAHSAGGWREDCL